MRATKYRITIRIPAGIWDILHHESQECGISVPQRVLNILIDYGIAKKEKYHHDNDSEENYSPSSDWARSKMAEKHTMADETEGANLPGPKQEWERLEKLALGESYTSADVRKLLGDEEPEPSEESSSEFPAELAELAVDGGERLKRIYQEIKETGR